VRHYGVELPLFEGISPFSKRSILNGRYERGEARSLIRNLLADDVVLEIGGGLGFISTLAALLIGSDRVHCFEANPALIPRIEETYRRNGVAPTLRNVILGDGPGAQTFYVEDELMASSTHRLSGSARAVQVPQLDARAEIARTGASFLVIDIEGGERELVPLIDWKPVRAVILELHPGVIGERGGRELQSLLAAQGLARDRWASSTHKLYFERPQAALRTSAA
jgi:FkbM family methyltransferase